MKNLRQLLRSYRNTGNKHRSQRARRSEVTQRQLSTEMLERRELLAAGILQSHNPWNQFDVNNDRSITARDALGVINYLGRGESEQVSTSSDRMFYDVNGDDAITAADALSVINAIGRGEGMEDQLIELLLTARQYDADPGGSTDGFDLDLIGPDSEVETNGIGQTTRTVPDANQVIEVDVNEVFELEVSYEDLRSFPNRLGAFQLITNVVADQQGFLQPVLFETQQLVVDQSIRDIPVDDRADTTITLSIPNSPPGVPGSLTYEASWVDFAANAPTQVRLALFEFGYSTDQYELSIPEGVDPDDIAFQIHWTDIAFADVDLPNIEIEVNEVAGAADISATEEAFDPTVLVNGTPEFNPEAIPFNLNTKSRSFDDNEPFYTANNDGNFDPATGFTGIKGIGGVPSQGGGIPQLLNELEYPAGPFDFVSLPVKIVAPVTGLQISVEPNADNGAQTEAILIYGEDERLPITNETVVIEGANDVDMNSNGKATIIISAIDPNGDNNDPVESAQISETFSEDQGTQTIDLLQFVTDPDGDGMSVTLGTISGDTSNAVTEDGTSINVATGNYDALNDGESVLITVPFTVSDGQGGTLVTSASITINGVTDVDPNQSPVESAQISETFSEDQGTQTIDLLQFVTDPDGDGMSVTLGTISGDTSNAVTEDGTSINVATGNYDALNDGESVLITVPFTVSDGQGGTLVTSASITINGVTDVDPNQSPVESAQISETFSEDQGTQTIDLLQFVTDPDGDGMSVTLGTISGDTSNAVTEDGTSINVATGNYDALNDGESVLITVPFTVSDGQGGTLVTSASITINGVTDVDPNQSPVESAQISETFSEDQGTQTIDLLQFVTDPDGDGMSVTLGTISGDTSNAVTEDGTSINVATGNYDALNDGESVLITVPFTVSDGQGGTLVTSASITINGVTDVDPNQSPVESAQISETFSEDQGTQTIDLLQFVTDPDGDGMSVTLGTISGDTSNAVTEDGTSINVATGNYDALNDGESVLITVPFTVSDGQGGTLVTSASITINGVTDVDPNQSPVESAQISETFSEDQGTQTIDLLQFVTDPDGDGMSVTLGTISGDTSNAVTEDGTSINVATGNYDALNDGESVLITVPFTVSDGQGGTLVTSASITINGVTDVDPNQSPVESAQISETFSEDQGTQTIDLLQFVTDPDGDGMSVTLGTISGDTSNAVTEDGTSINVATGNYDALNDGESVLITVPFTVSDGQGGTLVTSASITINGVTDNSDPTATPLSQSFDEGAAVATVDLLANAMDVDQGQTLSVVGLVRTSGNAVGITEGTNSLAVDPSDYGFLLPGQSEVITYTYRVIDGQGGSVSTSATVTINGTVDDAPSAGNVDDVTTPKDSGPITIDVLSAASPGAGETQALSIVSASLANPAAGTVTFNGTLVFTPAAGFEGDTTINYAVGDGTSTDGGTVGVTVIDFVPSTVGGDVFIDRIENMSDVYDGATPFRDGMKDTNEQVLAGVPITLMGNGMEWITYTDMKGSYEFENVAPGTYEVIYMKPENVIYNGLTTRSITIGAAGGVFDDNQNFVLGGLKPSATSAIDILARNHLKSNVSIAEISDGGREGAVVSLGDDGMSSFILAGEGFEEVRFAEVRSIDGSDTDAALLTVLTESGDVKSAIIPHDNAITSSDGLTMRFFGGMDDFPFQDRGSNVTTFDDFQNAIDQIHSDDDE